MDLLLTALVLLVAGAALSVALPGNKIRIAVNLLSQAIACGLVLTLTVPILLGGEAINGSLEWSHPFEQIDVRLGPLGAFFLTFSLPMTFLGSIYAVGYLAQDIRGPRNVGVHFGLLSMVQVSFLIVYTAQNAFAFLIGWEFAALSAWLLVIWDHRNQKVRFAGFNYLISTHLGLLFLVTAIMIMDGDANNFQFLDFQEFLHTPGLWRNVTFVLLMISFGLKSAFFPFHTWLPRAHSAAPAHVSALMSGVIHKAGLFGMLKFILMFGQPEEWMGWFIVVFSSISAFMGVLYTISQRDIKRLLGYSSTENVGIAGIGFGMGCLGITWEQPLLVALGFGGGLLHVLNHAFFKCLLFYGAGSIYRFTHTIDMEKLGGLMKLMRWTGPLFLFGSLASAALPPLNGFVSEFLIYLGLTHPQPESGQVRVLLLLVAAVLALVGGLSALSITRAFGLMFLGSPREPDHMDPEARENGFMIAPMLIHLLGIVGIGVFPSLGLDCVSRVVDQYLDLAGVPGASFYDYVPVSLINSVTLVGGLFLAILAVLSVARFMLLPRCERRHVTWGCGYTLGNSRMQYTGAAFSHSMAVVFRDLLRFITKEKLPRGVFPKNGMYETYCVDSVEQMMFKALDDGDKAASRLIRWLPDSTRLSFGIGLLAMVVLVIVVLVG